MFVFPIFCFFCLTLFFSFTFFKWKYWVNQITQLTNEKPTENVADHKLLLHYESVLKEKSKNFPYSFYTKLFLKAKLNAQEKGQ